VVEGGAFGGDGVAVGGGREGGREGGRGGGRGGGRNRTCKKGLLDVIEEGAFGGDSVAVGGVEVLATQGLGGTLLGLEGGREGGREGGKMRINKTSDRQRC